MNERATRHQMREHLHFPHDIKCFVRRPSATTGRAYGISAQGFGEARRTPHESHSHGHGSFG